MIVAGLAHILIVAGTFVIASWWTGLRGCLDHYNPTPREENKDDTRL